MNKNPNHLNEISKHVFTAHNIDLGNGLTTFNINPNSFDYNNSFCKKLNIDTCSWPIIGEMPFTKAIIDFLKLTHKFDNRDVQIVLDLGCLEGGYTLELAKLGFLKCFGIEGRQQNVQKCNAVKDYLQIDNAVFIKDDVKNLHKYSDSYNIILCLGLLYHLDSPMEFLEVMHDKLAGDGILFLETHYSPDNESEFDSFALKGVYKDKKPEIITWKNNPYKGSWWYEYEDQLEESKQPLWSALSNSKSFVLTNSSLLKALFCAGFSGVYQLHLPYSDYDKKWMRIILVCLK